MESDGRLKDGSESESDWIEVRRNVLFIAGLASHGMLDGGAVNGVYCSPMEGLMNGMDSEGRFF